MKWQPIETAPKDGTEILAWREDAGVFVVKWTALEHLMSEKEIDDMCKPDGNHDWLEQEDWFVADFIRGNRLEGDLIPTHWRPIPKPPEEDLK